MIAELLRDRRCVVLDGGLATELNHAGIAMRAPLFSAQALLSRPGRTAVERAHAAFLAAGADVITANTFRTNPRALRIAGGDEAAAATLTRIAVLLANRAVAEHGAAHTIVAASVAPVAECYDPRAVPDNRTLELEHGMFAAVLARLGVRVALIETMNCVREAVIATRAARRHGIAAWVSFVCGPDARLLSGEPVLDAAHAVADAGAEAALVNCADLAVTDDALAALRGFELPIGAYPNMEDRTHAGSHSHVPLQEALGPTAFAREVNNLVGEFSLSLAGGCCGARPAHICRLADSLEHINEGVLR
jgi:S-methylmethionine-dependent homocysteine/selenocysteine methylase